MNSIPESGQLGPITINNKVEVLDGHNRLRVCEKLKLEPHFEVKTKYSCLHHIKQNFLIPLIELVNHVKVDQATNSLVKIYWHRYNPAVSLINKIHL
jgi:hypothetical protein